MNPRRLLHRYDRQLARTWQQHNRQRQNAADRAASLHFEELTRTEDPAAIRVARARTLGGQPFWARLSIQRLLSLHTWVTGGTGSGKTFWTLGILLQLLRRRPSSGRPHPRIFVDFKGELTQLLLQIVLPVLALRPDGRELLRNLRVVRPFDRLYVPPLRITLPEPGVAHEIQAYNIVASVEEALGEDLGARMERVLLRLSKLAIELNLPLTEVRSWLEFPDQLAASARRSADPTLLRYAYELARRETRLSLDALYSRLDRFLFLAETRLALEAPDCLDFSECLESGLTIIDLGDPPAGAERAARFFAALLLGRLTRAVLSRPVSPDSPPALVVLEEFQEALARRQVDAFERVLALARFRKVSLWLINQQPAQLNRVDPSLVKLIRTNTGLEVAFRCSLPDATAFAHALPVPRSNNATAARQALTEEMTRLPRRHFYLWLREAPFPAQRVVSPRLDIDRLRREAELAPEGLLAAIRCGTVSLPRPELESADQSAPKTNEPPAPVLTPDTSSADSSFPVLG